MKTIRSSLALAVCLAAITGCNRHNEECVAKSEAPVPSSVSTAVAETPQAHAKAPEQLKQGEPAKLAILVGEWKGSGTLEMGGKTIPVTSVVSCTVERGGVAVGCEHEMKMQGMGTAIENMLFGYDPVGKKLVETIRFQLLKDALTFHSESTLDGQREALFQGTLHKQS